MSAWLSWHKARWLGTDVPDFVIDDDGAFYCDHTTCGSLEEHRERCMGMAARAAGGAGSDTGTGKGTGTGTGKGAAEWRTI